MVDLSLIQYTKNLIQNTMSLNFTYLTYPYEHIDSVDLEMRKGLENSELLYQSLRDMLSSVQYGFFYEYIDKYHLHYTIIQPFSDSKDLIFLGPYLTDSITDQVIADIGVHNRLNNTQIDSIKNYMYQFPQFTSNIPLIPILNSILEYINPDTANFKLYNDTLMESDNYNNNDYRPLNNYSVYAKTVENRYHLEQLMQQEVSKGNLSGLADVVKKFRSLPMEPLSCNRILEIQSMLNICNTILRKGAEMADVHPVHLHRISMQICDEIMNITDERTSELVLSKILRKYCNLVKNKGRNQYSKLIRDALIYIDVNIGEPLSLSTVADELHVTPQYLSKRFKQEYHTSITDYIINEKMQIALKLISTTDMQIQEIGQYLGIYDSNYFIKLFKKNVGCTPNQYRKDLQTR